MSLAATSKLISRTNGLRHKKGLMAVELPPLALLSGMLCFEHLLALQEKLNAYIAFIESGDIYTEIPGALGKSPIIRIIGKYELSEQGELLVDRATEVLKEVGIGLEFVLTQDDVAEKE
ncbi:DUF6572 domain-containing protein [Pseudomonas sp. TSRC2-2]|uniref:DUF6572 domain-containing protein n=1 Tax=unclassified Pseudomonas TaxID=196821 RepID=UPI003CF11AEA